MKFALVDILIVAMESHLKRRFERSTKQRARILKENLFIKIWVDFLYTTFYLRLCPCVACFLHFKSTIIVRSSEHSLKRKLTFQKRRMLP